MRLFMRTLATAGAIAMTVPAQAAFGPGNPFYAPSPLPFQAPQFDKIQDADYQPAIDAGIDQQLAEIQTIARNPESPTLENTVVALERSGRLLDRVSQVFFAVTSANTNSALQQVQQIEAPRLAALHDAIYLNPYLFRRVETLYLQRSTLHLDAESLRLVEYYYREFVHAGAKLSDADKTELKKINEEISTLQNDFRNKLLAATKDAAFATTDKNKLAGLSAAQLATAAQDAEQRKQEGWVLTLQNTTQQPNLTYLTDRSTRQQLFEDSWNRAERGGNNDTRATVLRLAQLRAQKAALLGYPNFAAWKLEDQMAKNPEAAIKFMDALVAPATANAATEAADIRALSKAEL